MARIVNKQHISAHLYIALEEGVSARATITKALERIGYQQSPYHTNGYSPSLNLYNFKIGCELGCIQVGWVRRERFGPYPRYHFLISRIRPYYSRQGKLVAMTVYIEKLHRDRAKHRMDDSEAGVQASYDEAVRLEQEYPRSAVEALPNKVR